MLNDNTPICMNNNSNSIRQIHYRKEFFLKLYLKILLLLFTRSPLYISTSHETREMIKDLKSSKDALRTLKVNF